ncbi:hypothetical protein K2D_17620 [Planctomycetes bacterium K2D]|uniref:Uncharacterized protein n=1 Tax=Botrimarina mediterranea TaxID=2528022 RepID=A0A518K6Z8_9BACT|nr:hypothetical protein Spa11_17630 [Botrimarina mediterranea]QDV78156.1 hypothetical protein K2D_17620 [Planctomycetes bacterium K2D]
MREGEGACAPRPERGAANSPQIAEGLTVRDWQRAEGGEWREKGAGVLPAGNAEATPACPFLTLVSLAFRQGSKRNVTG